MYLLPKLPNIYVPPEVSRYPFTMPMDLEEEEASVKLNAEIESAKRGLIAARKSLFTGGRSKSVDNPPGPSHRSSSTSERIIGPKPRRLSNQFSMEMSRCRCSADLDVVDDALRNEDLDEIQVHVTNARAFGLSSSFLRRKKDEYEGDTFDKNY